MPWVDPEEVDRALAQRRLRLARANIRPARCCLVGCLLPIPSGKGRHLVIDGVSRGIVCVNHQWAILETARTGKDEL